ncbi:hypothetical protein VMCG_07604 [Cytospora schulzeri]|uniref:Uncharacterized protein n=1 Tax=Cytospora schulzeri TaxID=448051 RepID=A0A423VXF4_9PEZI|nr:hypothetical protein VMCG_07604 [Valsa malicola]
MKPVTGRGGYNDTGIDIRHVARLRHHLTHLSKPTPTSNTEYDKAMTRHIKELLPQLEEGKGNEKKALKY